MIDMLGLPGVVFLTSWGTLLLVAETEPEIDEYGDKHYSLKGYILLATAYCIKLGIRSITKLIIKKQPEQVAQSKEENLNLPRNRNDYELIV